MSRYPLAEMLAAGVRVAVGTDSRASNPDLSLLEELRHIARHHPTVPPDEVLRMGTLAGAEALGLAIDSAASRPANRALAVAQLVPTDPWSLLTSESRPAIEPLAARLSK